MTNGQLIFYMGIALLIVTVILVVIFALKKPKYVPESAAYIGGNANTQKLRNGYPTNRLTIRRDTKQSSTSETAILSNETMPLAQDFAEMPLSTTATLKTGKSNEQETKSADFDTIPLSDKTALLSDVGEDLPVEVTVKLGQEETKILKTNEADEENKTVLLH